MTAPVYIHVCLDAAVRHYLLLYLCCPIQTIRVCPACNDKAICMHSYMHAAFVRCVPQCGWHAAPAFLSVAVCCHMSRAPVRVANMNRLLEAAAAMTSAWGCQDRCSSLLPRSAVTDSGSVAGSRALGGGWRGLALRLALPRGRPNLLPAACTTQRTLLAANLSCLTVSLMQSCLFVVIARDSLLVCTTA